MVRVETGLTPKQAVFAWMEKAHRFPSLFAYLGSVLADSDAGYPLDWLEAKLDAAVSQALRGQLPARIDRAKKAAYREAVVLYHLHYQAVPTSDSSRRSGTWPLPYSRPSSTAWKSLGRANDRSRHRRGWSGDERPSHGCEICTRRSTR